MAENENVLRSESILTSIKKNLGIEEDYTQFDPDIIMHINSVFTVLNELGIGPEDGFVIKDSSTIWSEYIGDSKKIELVKSYITLKVKMLFDPPLSSAVIDVINKQINEFEFRLNVMVDPDSEEE